MKLLLIIPFLFCMQDTVKVDTIRYTQMKMFFAQRTNEQRITDINFKLDLLIKKLENDTIKNDTIKIKKSWNGK